MVAGGRWWDREAHGAGGGRWWDRELQRGWGGYTPVSAGYFPTPQGGERPKAGPAYTFIFSNCSAWTGCGIFLTEALLFYFFL